MAALNRFLVIASLLLVLSLNLHHLVEADQAQGTNGTQSPIAPMKIDCGAACATRCSKTKRPNLCKRSCGSCCARCQCVPPGTSGNYEACPCYANIITTGNRRKCP